ncbi:MAG: DUF4492 domain-containing protein [Desulfobulbaceae bacterium]|nr:DUF4492 domain-containing protein [Desulfobulbaceae bacterium]
MECGKAKHNVLIRIYRFYSEGFRSMTLGRTLWKIIIIKLLIMFGVLKLFFFQNYLKTNFANDEERAGYVLEQLTKPARNNQSDITGGGKL